MVAIDIVVDLCPNGRIGGASDDGNQVIGLHGQPFPASGQTLPDLALSLEGLGADYELPRAGTSPGGRLGVIRIDPS